MLNRALGVTTPFSNYNTSISYLALSQEWTFNTLQRGPNDCNQMVMDHGKASEDGSEPVVQCDQVTARIINPATPSKTFW